MCFAIAALGFTAAETFMAGTALVGAGLSAYSAVAQGDATKKAADQNADLQRKTAISTENAAAGVAADRIQKARLLAGSQVASAGAGGVDPVTGTPLTLEAQTMQKGELDSLRIISNAQRTAWGYEAQGNIDEMQGDNAQTAGYMNAGSSLLGGLSKASQPYFGKPS